ncbi:MAG: hypothetical protein LBJ08_10690 [Bifidobacteriaceae bacterium]|jgi:hypothetical protein|nr:hypothetical protein [Bifidobacteriaceae bacterium]
MTMKSRGVSPFPHDPKTLEWMWRASSVRSAWLRPGDWRVPEIEAVVEFVAKGADAESALEALGLRRALNGVGLAETLADVHCLTDLAGDRLDPWSCVEAVARGWQDGSFSPANPAVMLDPDTTLATLPYLGVRLKEIYASAEAAGSHASRTHCLLVAETAIMCTDPWLRLERGALLGSVLAAVFTRGETLVSLGCCSGAAIVLLPREANLGRTLRYAKRRIEVALLPVQRAGGARHPVRVWVESLPRTYRAALAQVEDLAR